MPSARPGKKRKSASPRRRSSARARSAANRRRRSRRTFNPRMPVLDQRQRDVLGLGLVAVGVYLGFVLYGHWAGGRLGHGLELTLGFCVGKARALAPAALIAGGGVLLLRPVLPALRPLRTGATCLFCSVTLALAAGTLGITRASGSAQWHASSLDSHGGLSGQLLFWVAHRLVQ